MNENPEFDIVEITRKTSIDMLNNIEMSDQEAAGNFLRLPISKSSVAVQYIDTCWRNERQRLTKQMDEVDDNSTYIRKEGWKNWKQFL